MRYLALLLLAAAVFAQPVRPPSPPPPAKYDIDIVYRIEAFRTERARQFKELVAQLKDLGFERDPVDEARGEDNLEVENFKVTRMRGTIPGESLRQASRLRPVLTVLVKSAGSKLPLADQPVRVDFDLSSDIGSTRQRLLASEVARVLAQKPIDLKQPAGYDNRRYTRILGSMPAGQLEAILNDIRRLPSAWEQLPSSLLSDMRASIGGEESVRAILDQWASHAEGGKLVLAALEGWVVQEPAASLIAKLPALVVNDAALLSDVREAQFQRKPLAAATRTRLVDLIRRNEVVREQVLLQFQRHPDARPLMTKLLQSVFKDKSGPELMDILLRRVEGREAGVSLPQLFRERTVIRIIEARPDLPLPEPSLPPPTVPDELHRIGPALRDLLKDMAKAGNPRRLEIILSSAPGDLDRSWVRMIEKAAPSFVLEGHLGPVVSGQMKPSEAAALVKLPGIAAVRLPQEARTAVLTLPEEEGDPAKAIRDAGIEPLIRLGKPPRPVRVAVIDGDFRGWQGLVGKKLPALTRLLDITGERHDTFKGDPFPGPADQLGSGTLTAMAVALAAPWCEMLLVRVDPAAPHQLALVQRRMNGEEYFTDSFQQRRIDIVRGREFLKVRSTALLAERLAVLKLFADDRPAEDPISKARQERRDEYLKKQAEFDKREKEFLDHEKFYLRYITELEQLRTIRVVVCGLSWTEGYPADGGSALTRVLDNTPAGRVLWVQAAGNGHGQAWSGLFRDVDGNRVMEFADQKTPLPAGNWNHELAFLAWQPFKGERAKTAPGKTRLRLTMQWREAHDPEYTKDLEDPFREPLSKLRLIVMKQLDPEGAKRPADDLVAIAETSGPPLRLVAEPGSAVYEHVIEFTADPGVRLGLRVEGVASKSTRPPGTAELPGTDQFTEIYPRIFIETLDAGGRVVFESYARDVGDFGALSDARQVLTVGAISAESKPRQYSTAGSPHGLELLEKPDLRTFDRLGIEGATTAGGNGMSAGLIGGYAASLLAHGTPMENVRKELQRRLKSQ